MESPDMDGCMPFLDNKCLPYKDPSIQTSGYRKTTNTDQYLDWNSNHLISAKKSVHALIYRAKNVCSNS